MSFEAAGHRRVLGAVPRELGANGEHLGESEAGVALRGAVGVPRENFAE